jgi:hypothetical protein
MTLSPPPDCLDRLNDRRLTRSTIALGIAALLVLSAVAVGPAVGQSDGSIFEVETESVHSTANATIEGTTSLDSGTEIRVRVSSAGETSPQFLQTTSTTVGPDGVWNATFDLSAVETHDSVTVSVSVADGDQSADFDVPIRDDAATATDSGSATSTPGFGILAALSAFVAGVAALQSRQ